ncbi:MAG: hypothetical protein K2L08_06930, partial [Erysipelotrichaceae bacterium]|nr:hypothetical protein [Erysipelotrichaceae bacterium]
MNSSKKSSKDLHSIPAFRKVKSHTPTKEYSNHEPYHDLDAFQQEIHSLHLDAQEHYTQICKSSNLEEKLPENFMDPDWFQREAKNRKKRKARTSLNQNNDASSLHKHSAITSTSSTTTATTHSKKTEAPRPTLSFKFPNTNERHLKTSTNTPQTNKIRKHNSIPTSKIHTHESNYSSFLKWNALIFVIVFLQMLLFLSFYALYLQKLPFLHSLIPLEGSNMILRLFITSFLFAYQIASLHCGYTLMKHSLIKAKKGRIIICFPILFILTSILGLLCEIPYFIFSCFQLSK